VKRPPLRSIAEHLRHRELAEDSVCSILEHTAGDGKTYSPNTTILMHHRRRLPVNTIRPRNSHLATKTLRNSSSRLRAGRRTVKRASRSSARYFEELLERIGNPASGAFYQDHDIYALSWITAGCALRRILCHGAEQAALAITADGAELITLRDATKLLGLDDVKHARGRFEIGCEVRRTT